MFGVSLDKMGLHDGSIDVDQALDSGHSMIRQQSGMNIVPTGKIHEQMPASSDGWSPFSWTMNFKGQQLGIQLLQEGYPPHHQVLLRGWNGCNIADVDTDLLSFRNGSVVSVRSYTNGQV
jgi:hypothetical protein